MSILYNNILWDDFRDSKFICPFTPKGQEMTIYILESEINLYREQDNISSQFFGKIQFEGLYLKMIKKFNNEKDISLRIIGLVISQVDFLNNTLIESIGPIGKALEY